MKLFFISMALTLTLTGATEHLTLFDDTKDRNLMGRPHFYAETKSTGGSKVAWRIFEKDNDPHVQDDDENSIEFVHVKDYSDGQQELSHMIKGEEYCLRVFKGDDTSEFGPNSGSNTIHVFYFDGLVSTKVKDAHVFMRYPKQKHTCFFAREDLLEKYPPEEPECPLSYLSAQDSEYVLIVKAIGAFDAWKASEVSDEAWEKSRKSNLGGEHDGKEDAFRHCYFSCRLTQEIGLKQALEAGDIHESCFFHGEENKNMDLHNNRIGAVIGENGPEYMSTCQDGCMDAIANQELIWIKLSRHLSSGLRGNN